MFDHTSEFQNGNRGACLDAAVLGTAGLVVALLMADGADHPKFPVCPYHALRNYTRCQYRARGYTVTNPRAMRFNIAATHARATM